MTHNGHATYQRSLTVEILWKNGAIAPMRACCKLVTIPMWFSDIYCTACNHKAFFIASIFTGAFAFTAGTPNVTINSDGETYDITVQFSAGNGGRFECILRNRVLKTLVVRRPCTFPKAEFTGVEVGRYLVKVRRRSQNIREVITARVNIQNEVWLNNQGLQTIMKNCKAAIV